uniref:Putative TolB family protein n=1 Tax=termite gut metagenome TaxID=433724 RepID=S0DF85_9ZZZZ
MDYANYYDFLRDRAQTSVLQVYDWELKSAEVLAEFDHVIEAPNWSKDGRALYYNANGKIYRFDLAQKTERPVATGEADTCNNDHVLSPDGKAIAVSSGRGGDFMSRIYTVDLATGQSSLVTPQPHSYLHGWSPDGKTLAFCGAREHGGALAWDVYTVPAAGGQELRLTTAEGLDDGPEYSPDGKYIWFNSARTGLMQVWRMKADGGEQTQMTFDEGMNAWFPHLSPDGERLVYLAYHRGDLQPGEHLPDKQVELRTIPVGGGEEKTLLKLFGGQGSINVNSWAPNSRQFAFVSYVAGR